MRHAKCDLCGCEVQTDCATLGLKARFPHGTPYVWDFSRTYPDRGQIFWDLCTECHADVLVTLETMKRKMSL